MPELYLPESKTFDYDDVILVPEKCIVKSRSEVSVTATFGGREFALPVIPANMSTVVDETTCEWLAKRDIFYVMHRFDIDAVAFTKDMQSKGLYASVSLGIKPVDYATVDRFVAEAIVPEYITVDVAHGDSDEVVRVVEYIKKNLPTSFVIAGNLATVAGAERLVAAGADALKVGIGPGMACLTAPNTGFGSKGWQLSALADIAEHFKASPVQIIADGGIREYGDIAKSIAFGADMIMIGSILASHLESPGELIEIDGEYKKAFFGSASEHQKGEHKHVEGRKLYMPYKGSLDTTLQIIKENLQSSVSYAGGNKLSNLTNVKYVLLRK
jgi:GMP reductase